MTEKINSPEIPSVKREVYKLHNSEIIVSPQQAKGGVKLMLGGEDGPTFRVCPVEMLPKDSEGHPLLGNVRINPNRSFVLLDDSSSLSEDGTGIKGLRPGEGITLGRQGSLVEERFPDSNIRGDQRVSRSHLDIRARADGSIAIVDHSTNGTEVDVVAKVDEGPANPWDSLAQWPETPKVAPGEFIDGTPWSDPRPVDASHSEVLAAGPSQEDMRITRLRKLSTKPLPRGYDSSGNNLDRRLEVTAQSLEDAALAYRYSDYEIKNIIYPYMTDEVWREGDIHQLVRNNDELRFQLMQYLMDKLDRTPYLPDRLRRNTEKRLNYVGYEKMSSREAAAVLALEMLSGTYKRTTDSIDINKFGEVVQGQHRWGAMLALGVERTGYAQSVMNIRRR